MRNKWPSLVAWLFLAILLLLFIGWSEFSWKLTKVVPLAITSLLLFFQFLTVSRLKSRFLARINFTFLIVQVLLLSCFIFDFLELKSIWKINLVLLLAASHIYLLDMNNRYIQNRTYSKWILLFTLVVSLISFVLVQYYDAAMSIGFSSTSIAGLFVLSNIFLFDPKKEN